MLPYFHNKDVLSKIDHEFLYLSKVSTYTIQSKRFAFAFQNLLQAQYMEFQFFQPKDQNFKFYKSVSIFYIFYIIFFSI